jgi:hypothetical protein
MGALAKINNRVASRIRAPEGTLIMRGMPMREPPATPRSIEPYHPCRTRRAPRHPRA